jgi:hypothetical protein
MARSSAVLGPSHFVFLMIFKMSSSDNFSSLSSSEKFLSYMKNAPSRGMLVLR